MPVSPASVFTRTTICLRVLPVQDEGGSSGFMGMARQTASTAVIFMRLHAPWLHAPWLHTPWLHTPLASHSIVERFRETRGLDAHGIERVRAQPREKAPPVGDAVD